MQVKETNRKEIETRLSSMGDYVKIDYLSSCLKNDIDFDTRKFVLLKLAILYEGRGMFAEAGKLMNSAAEINTTFQNKITDYLKSAELFIKAGQFDDAETTFSKALACGNERQKFDIKAKRKELYKSQGKVYLNKDKRNHAMQAYERMLTFDLNAEEKREVQSTLLHLYEKLGKIREYYSLKNSM